MSHDLNDLRLFTLVAEAGGYAKASRQSGISRATLSRRVAALEEAIGLLLIARNSRSFRLTAPGERLFAEAKVLIAEADDLLTSLSDEGAAPTGRIRLAVPPSLLRLHLDDFLLAFIAEHPGIQLEIEATNRRVDLLKEGFDFAIRAGHRTSGLPDQVIVNLAKVAHHLVIAPSLADRVAPSLAETLKAVQALAWGSTDALADWGLLDNAGRLVRLPLRPGLLVEDMEMLRKAALAGAGMALLPEVMIAEDLKSGRLIAPKLDLIAPEGRIHAIHPGHRSLRPAVRLLLDWLKPRYQQLC